MRVKTERIASLASAQNQAKYNYTSIRTRRVTAIYVRSVLAILLSIPVTSSVSRRPWQTQNFVWPLMYGFHFSTLKSRGAAGM